MISNQIRISRHIARPVGITLYDVEPTVGKTRVDLSDATAYLCIENEAQTGFLVNALCDIDGDPTQGRIVWTPNGTEFNGLTYPDEKPKRQRTYAMVVKGDGTYIYPEYGGYSYIHPDIPLT